jgi:Ca-activated chloride channel family protein
MRKFISFLIAFIAVTLTTAAALAQNRDDERLIVGTNLVSVNVSVTDGRGRSVMGLTKDRFEVFDNLTRQTLAHFSDEEAPFSLGIVYDMHPTTPERTAATLRALKQFTRALRREDDFFLMVFNERGSVIVDFIPTTEQVNNHLTFVAAGGPTALYDAVFKAAERVRSARNPKKALLIISDGENHNSGHSDKEIRSQVGEFNIQVYGVGVADLRGSGRAGDRQWMFEDITRRIGGRAFLSNTNAAFGLAVLEEMSRVSGGTAYFPDRVDNEQELFGICMQIALEMRQQYTLAFYPTAASTDSKRHKLRVRVTPQAGAGKFRLSYREGYQLSENKKVK